MLSNKNSLARAKNFLFLDALAPMLGVLATLFFKIPPTFLVLYLGFFAGFLLYISASDILPQAHSKKSSYQLMSLTILGGSLFLLFRDLLEMQEQGYTLLRIFRKQKEQGSTLLLLLDCVSTEYHISTSIKF